MFSRHFLKMCQGQIVHFLSCGAVRVYPTQSETERYVATCESKVTNGVAVTISCCFALKSDLYLSWRLDAFA